MELSRLLADALPVTSDLVEVQLAPEQVDPDTGEVHGGTYEDPRGYWRATLRLIVWEVDADDGVRRIHSVKEQDVVWLFPEHRADPRLAAFIHGWAAALRQVLGHCSERILAGDAAAHARLAAMMPRDLCHPDVLALRRPRSADDFADALLGSRQRLGPWMD